MIHIYAEIADSHLKRSYGLMDRKYLPKNSGMLFKFNGSEKRMFWMQNTYIPLDIAFIDYDGKIQQISEGIPLSTKGIYSDSPCKYVLEMNKDWFKKNNISVGGVVGGLGISKYAQLAEQNQSAPNQQEDQNQANFPDVLINKSYKEIIDEANLKDKELVIVYQKKDGYSLPPKVIQPPFEFDKDSDGNSDSVVKAWDAQDAQWKSFLLDNIIAINFVKK